MSCRDLNETAATPEMVFCHTVSGVGLFELRPLSSADFGLLHQWVTAPRASFWGMQQATPEEVAHCYRQQIESAHCAPYLAFYAGQPAFLLETYDPAHDELGQHYAVQAGDIGMHFLVAPASGPAVHGFTRAVMQTILAFLFSQSRHLRVVVEPDVNNQKIHPINRDAGFCYQHTIELSYKTAWFAICDRASFLQATELETTA
ncbi:GNAT family N-acetyltransferase [Chitinibacter sp. FCG-7]|uniref:GNAT family N-acetyltransferase n=1 Tax=Chitinibacter mangrovi TaxID=3153927 RepID=A0AAU7F609_9NEIS